MEKYINQIIHADCMDILKQLPDKCIDLVLTDPPYGIGVNKMTMFDGAKKQKRHKEYNDVVPAWEYFSEIRRIGCNLIIWGGNYFKLPPTRCFLIWDKIQNFSGADCELAWTTFDKPAKIYRMSRIEAYGKGTIHPTQKPLALFQWCLENFSKKNDLILDCFCGSGTTAVACHNLKRRFICIEKDYDYWKASVERLKIVQAQQRLNLEF